MCRRAENNREQVSVAAPHEDREGERRREVDEPVRREALRRIPDLPPGQLRSRLERGAPRVRVNACQEIAVTEQPEIPPPILVGFDGSEHGRDALALGRALAATLSTRLVVVIAYTPEQWLWAPGTADPMDRDARERVVAQAEAACSGEDRVEFHTVASPSAAGALHAEAERRRARIIVVGSSHRGAMGRMLLGTVTQEVLDAAPCAVAVAPPGLAANPEIRFSTVGVGFDDTPPAHDALAVARSFAAHARAELRLVWAAHLATRALPMAFTSYTNPDYFKDVRAEVEDRLEQAAAPIREDISVAAEILPGQTIAALVKQSERLDLLVLGSRGYGPLSRVLVGSVSRRVLNEARCPVLVVPRGVRTLANIELPADAAASEGGERVPTLRQASHAGER
jgi:nucleotide-binding universal stress UspA family protein